MTDLLSDLATGVATGVGTVWAAGIALLVAGFIGHNRLERRRQAELDRDAIAYRNGRIDGINARKPRGHSDRYLDGHRDGAAALHAEFERITARPFDWQAEQ